MMTQIVGFFVHRPVLVNLIFIFIFIFGLLSFSRFEYELNPTTDFGIVNITTTRPGAGPEDIELGITVPLEEELLKVDGLKNVNSRSMEGTSLITVRLDPDLGAKEKGKALTDIQKAVDRAVTRLPPDLIEKPFIEEISTANMPILEVHVTGEVSEELLRETARKVADSLREVDGVSGIRKLGFRRREVRILLEPEKLQQFQLSYGDIINAIARRNVRDSGGALESFLTEKQVVTIGQFDYPKQVEDVIIRSLEPGNDIKIRDVATVVLDYENWQTQTRTDGQKSIVLQIRKKRSADEKRTTNAIYAFLEEASKHLPVGVQLVTVNEISRFTQAVLRTLLDNAVIGFAGIFLILWAFFSIRQAVWVSLGLPFSIILTLVFMNLLGFSINTISLTALILVLGVLVDDAVVIGESFQRHLEKGLSPHDASIKGTVAVSAPVIVSGVTTILAFLPIAFLGGLEGKVMLVLPVVIALALLASLFESKFILPSHLAHGRDRVRRDNGWFERIRSSYRIVLAKLLARKFLSIAIFVLGFIGIVALGVTTLRFQLNPETEFDIVNVKIELPVGTGFDQTIERVSILENRIRKLIPARDLLNIVSRIGNHDTDIMLLGGTEGRSDAWAMISVFLTPNNEREFSSLKLVSDLRQLAKDLDGFDSIIIETPSMPTQTGKAVELEIIGNDATAYELVAKIEKFLGQHPAITEVWTSLTSGKDILEIKLDHELLRSRGLDANEVSRAIRVALDGLLVGELQTVDERVRFRIQHLPSNVGKLDTLENLIINNRNGDPIFLKSIADFNLRAGEFDIKHYFGKRTQTVYADIDFSKTSTLEINDDIAQYIEERGWLSQYPNVNIVYSGQLVQTRESLGNIGIAFATCIISILFVLVLLFNSFTQPFLIILAIPFSVCGVIIGFVIQSMPMSMMSMIGTLGLIGVLVNDSLVMVYSLNKRKAEGNQMLSMTDIVDGASERFRPIIITSVTTIVGLFPAAYGIAGTQEMIAPMLMAMAWGLLFGTVVSLVLLPCLYAANQDITAFLTRIFGLAKSFPAQFTNRSPRTRRAEPN